MSCFGTGSVNIKINLHLKIEMAFSRNGQSGSQSVCFPLSLSLALNCRLSCQQSVIFALVKQQETVMFVWLNQQERPLSGAIMSEASMGSRMGGPRWGSQLVWGVGSQTNTEPHSIIIVYAYCVMPTCVCAKTFGCWIEAHRTVTHSTSECFSVFNVCAIHKSNICAIYIDAIQQGFHQVYLESWKLVFSVHHKIFVSLTDCHCAEV